MTRKKRHAIWEEVDSIFNDLHAILDIPKDPTRQLRLHHPSFRDFLLSKDRCGSFWVDEKQAHQILAARCIQLMSLGDQETCFVVMLKIYELHWIVGCKGGSAHRVWDLEHSRGRA
ncbi:hypothetical protein BKA61DRAFT_212114 [Leptodontidium sp. MPI-SDFR-AT-0119]|nr:hypothetical protein BKA61DRAFT_212114 [Leptodontidium sp. MPI-SDFR-AT-0119]